MLFGRMRTRSSLCPLAALDGLEAGQQHVAQARELATSDSERRSADLIEVALGLLFGSGRQAGPDDQASLIQRANEVLASQPLDKPINLGLGAQRILLGHAVTVAESRSLCSANSDIAIGDQA